jgi:osmotically-inducible protein OsmY
LTNNLLGPEGYEPPGCLTNLQPIQQPKGVENEDAYSFPVALAILASQAVFAANEGGKAESAVQSTPNIEVTAPALSDDTLAIEVRQKIENRPSLKFFRISVWCVDHAVYLDGQVDTGRDSGEAEDVARSVPGVRKVYNYLYFNNA